MKPLRRRILLFALLLAFSFALATAACNSRGSVKVLYHCPMHPTYISDRPGDCPICGMRLVPMENSPTPAPAEAATVYTCPMHPEVIADHPGKCPICSMDLVLKESTPAASAAMAGKGKILYYRSPMDPKVTSPVPAKDEMGMDFVPVYEGEVVENGGNAVSGMAPVTLSPQGMDLAGVQTAAATESRIGGVIRTVGTVIADETRIKHLHTKVSGTIEKLYGDFIGQAVKAGQPILAIYSPELLASQEEYLRAMETAKKFANSSLPEVQAGGNDLVTAARRRLELFDVPASLIAKIEQTGQPQRTVTIVAPAGGFITAKQIFEGQQVDPSMELFTITDLSHVWIEADFYEYEIPRLRLGQKAELTLSFDPSVRLDGRVAYIYPTLSATSRTLKVRFDVPNKNLILKPAMYANVELSVDESTGITFPESAVLDTGARQVVFVETAPGRFEPREVRIGNKSAGMVQVQSGVAAGEKVVVRANFLLDSEARLKAAISATNGTPDLPHGGQ
ncbi:MAG: efflux RND transporter periplasmic adaptor subunit [Myxococcales bacterium]|nr:efflux RND transporter periplasmic adaptor subunit [Myxococcales bacterium]